MRTYARAISNNRVSRVSRARYLLLPEVVRKQAKDEFEIIRPGSTENDDLAV